MYSIFEQTFADTDVDQQDELETEIERLKDKLSRAQKKVSKGSTEASRPSTSISQSSSRTGIFSESVTSTANEEVCELCDRPGHDAFNCDMLKEGAYSRSSSRSNGTIDLYCEDCEGHGHTAANCPHSLDVF